MAEDAIGRAIYRLRGQRGRDPPPYSSPGPTRSRKTTKVGGGQREDLEPVRYSGCIQVEYPDPLNTHMLN